MRSSIAAGLTIPCLLLLFMIGICDAVPARISYQGSLEDSGGGVGHTSGGTDDWRAGGLFQDQ